MTAMMNCNRQPDADKFFLENEIYFETKRQACIFIIIESDKQKLNRGRRLIE
jgi:hypothetical protein